MEKKRKRAKGKVRIKDLAARKRKAAAVKGGRIRAASLRSGQGSGDP